MFAGCLLATSCSPVKRLERLHKNHPYLFENQRDTIRVPFEVIVPSVKHDTFFKHTHTKDTVTLVKDRLTIKYFNNGDTVYLSGKCDTITVRDTVSVEAVKYVYKDRKKEYIIPLVSVILILFVIGLVLYRIFTSRKF